MYRMLRSRTIDNSNGGSDSPARARVAGAGARKSSAGTNQQNQKKMSVPGSPTKNRPGQSKKYSIGATMVTSPLVASSGPPIALPKAPPLGSVDNNSGTQTPASPAAASLKKQRWSFAFRKRWFSSSVSGNSANSGCNSPVSARAAKVSVGSQGSDHRRQSEGSYTHGITKLGITKKFTFHLLY